MSCVVPADVAVIRVVPAAGRAGREIHPRFIDRSRPGPTVHGMANLATAALPRSPRRRLTHRPGTPRGATLRLSALAAAIARLHEEGREPEAWQARPADGEVAAVLAHLVPIQSRTALAASYAREGRRLLAGAQPSGRALEPVDALDVAYALRWIELADAANH